MPEDEVYFRINDQFVPRLIKRALELRGELDLCDQELFPQELIDEIDRFDVCVEEIVEIYREPR